MSCAAVSPSLKTHSFSAGNNCAAPSCTDTLSNGDETGKDCGGPTCTACDVGGKCNTGKDCKSGVCNDGACVAKIVDTPAAACTTPNITNGQYQASCPLTSGSSCSIKCNSGYITTTPFSVCNNGAWSKASCRNYCDLEEVIAQRKATNDLVRM